MTTTNWHSFFKVGTESDATGPQPTQKKKSKAGEEDLEAIKTFTEVMCRLSSIKEYLGEYIAQQSETGAMTRDTVCEAVALFIEAVENKHRAMIEVIEGAYDESDQALQEQVAKLRALLSSDESVPPAVDKQVKESLDAIVRKSVAFRFTAFNALKVLAKNLITIPGVCRADPTRSSSSGAEYLVDICETAEERAELVDFFKVNEVNSSSTPKEVLSKLFGKIALKDAVVPVSPKTLSVFKKVNAIKDPAKKLARAMELVESVLSKQSIALQALLEEIGNYVSAIEEMLSVRESTVVEVVEKKSMEEEDRITPYFAHVEELIQRCAPFLEKEEEDEEEALFNEDEEDDEKEKEKEKGGESEENKERKAVMEEAKSVIAEFSSMKSSGVIGTYSIEKDLIVSALEACFQVQIIKLENTTKSN